MPLVPFCGKSFAPFAPFCGINTKNNSKDRRYILKGSKMIGLTRINGQMFTLNAELIETVEETPDTLITLQNGKTIMVKESVAEVIREVVRYRRKVYLPKRKLTKR